MKTVQLWFDREVARLVEETIWHPSQVLKKQKDGSLIMTLEVMDTIELFCWILGWGQDVCGGAGAAGNPRGGHGDCGSGEGEMYREKGENLLGERSK